MSPRDANSPSAGLAAPWGLGHTASMEIAFWAALVATWMGGSLLAARQVAKGRRSFMWVLSAPQLVGLTLILWAAVRSWTVEPLLAIGLGVIGVPSLVLYIRSVKRRASAGEFEETGELSPQHFDYIVWMAVGMPFAFVGLLLLLLITGGLAGAR